MVEGSDTAAAHVSEQKEEGKEDHYPVIKKKDPKSNTQISRGH